MSAFSNFANCYNASLVRRGRKRQTYCTGDRMCFSLGFKSCPQKRDLITLFPSGPGLYICYSRTLRVRKSANTAYFVNKVYWSTAPFLLCIASMAFSFNMVKTKLNCCDRNHMTYKMQNIYHLALLKMFVFVFLFFVVVVTFYLFVGV